MLPIKVENIMGANDGDVIITIRMLMVGKEIGGIIGKGGSNVAKFREESGAKITISTAQESPERIVTISGAQSQIHKAVQMISDKMHGDLNSSLSSGATNKIPVTIQLIVPASQCGSIIGKGGNKIKEIRETTGCSIQVQSDMLPNSSERTVTLSGSPTTIVHCIKMLCDVMIQFPAKTATVPYKPQGGNSTPIIFHEGQAYVLQGQYGGASTSHEMGYTKSPASQVVRTTPRNRERRRSVESIVSQPASSLHSNLSSGTVNFPCRLVNSSTQELTVGNDIIGCIIGKGGSRIKEIRMLSGAQIKIDQGRDEETGDSTEDSNEDGQNLERKIVISGSPEEISLAQYLINLSVSMFSTNDRPGSSIESFTPQPLFNQHRATPALQVSQSLGLLGQPPNLIASSSFGSSGLLGAAAGSFGAALHTARRSLISKQRVSSGGRSAGRFRSATNNTGLNNAETDFGNEDDFPGDSSPNGKEKRKSRREKFQPY